jgi:c-di-GMP-related signal transduction protein
MKEIYLGRQPIYDSALQVEGYQLSYHPTDGEVMAENAPLLDVEMERTQILFNTLAEVGLEPLVGESKVFLNIARNLLDSGDVTTTHDSLLTHRV